MGESVLVVREEAAPKKRIVVIFVKANPRYRRTVRTNQKHRERSREREKSSNGFQLGLIGYTNEKSTILNQLTQAGTYQMDQLFATLDPITRQVDLFPISKVTNRYCRFYPRVTNNIEVHAFESTLEKVTDVDLLVHVVSNVQFSLHEKDGYRFVNDLEMQKFNE